MVVTAFYASLRFAQRAAMITLVLGAVTFLANTLTAGVRSVHVGGDQPAFKIVDFGQQWYSQAAAAGRHMQNLGYQLGLTKHPDDNGRVVRVADGDTITVVVGGDRKVVRILSVDTPETKHPNKPVECFGPAASKHTKKTLLRQKVKLTYDADRTDRYGRTLAYVTFKNRDFGADLLRGGYARTLFIEPNTSRASKYRRIQRQAKAKRRGLWGACS